MGTVELCTIASRQASRFPPVERSMAVSAPHLFGPAELLDLLGSVQS